MRLSELRLDISNPEASLDFYVGKLGMELVSENDFPEQEEAIYELAFVYGTRLNLRHRSGEAYENASYKESENDVYWKIGVTIADVDLARQRLIEGGIEVTKPCQFYDIGYLCHLEDPDGYCIELLQHRFGKILQPRPPMEGYPLGNEPRLGQISLTVRDAEESLAFYRDTLGMRLLSRQEVFAHGFTLTFLAFTDEPPPNPSINAVENREWLWQRPYTTLELRVYASHTQRAAHPPESQLGFRGISIAGPEAERQKYRDPDGVLVNITSDRSCKGRD
ncbi:MAG: lactoylglutathione lyase [Verrucomicrobiales bacterium]|jgi:lactoylglutathione lyase